MAIDEVVKPLRSWNLSEGGDALRVGANPKRALPFLCMVPPTEIRHCHRATRVIC